MDEQRSASISLVELYGAIGTAAAPILVDVRHTAAFGTDNRMTVGANRRDADALQNWHGELPAGRAVVVCCVHGHEVSQGAASALRNRGALSRTWNCGVGRPSAADAQ